MNKDLAAPALLARRLGRLRATTSIAKPRPFAAGSSTNGRAAALAAALGGRLAQTPAGPLVSIASAVSLPIEPGRLARLPFAPEVDGPLVCLDLETTGLGTGAGTIPFLVGLGIWRGTQLTVLQFVLPDHADEHAFLGALHEVIPANAWLVTYNGRSFDWPLLVSRFRLHRRDPPRLAGHIDLLPIARQLWRHRLGSARLATVERAICGVERKHDLPGALVPERYFSYLRLRQAELLRDVVDHNRQDIISLGRLLQVLAAKLTPEAELDDLHPGDLAGLARAYAQRGRPGDVLLCLEAALASSAWSRGVIGGAALYRRLASERALTLARLGRRIEAVEAWQELADRGGPGAALAWIRIAIHREHSERNFEGALEACRHAADICSRSRAWGRPLHGVERDLQKRLPRLQRRSRSARVSRVRRHATAEQREIA